MGSNIMARGVYTLLVDIVKYLPGPDKKTCAGINAKTNEVYQADYNFAKPKSAYVFKTIVDPFIGKYSLIKVNSGVLKTDDVLYNYHKGVEEKIGKLYVLRGNKAEEVKELHWRAGKTVEYRNDRFAFHKSQSNPIYPYKYADAVYIYALSGKK